MDRSRCKTIINSPRRWVILENPKRLGFPFQTSLFSKSVNYLDDECEVSAMPKINRRRTPFCRRREPNPEYDIRLLRPPSLPLGERFETLEDVRKYNLDSEHRLDLSARQQDQLSDRLNECRTSNQHCGQSFCPICARLIPDLVYSRIVADYRPHRLCPGPHPYNPTRRGTL